MYNLGGSVADMRLAFTLGFRLGLVAGRKAGPKTYEKLLQVGNVLDIAKALKIPENEPIKGSAEEFIKKNR